MTSMGGRQFTKSENLKHTEQPAGPTTSRRLSFSLTHLVFTFTGHSHAFYFFQSAWLSGLSFFWIAHILRECLSGIFFLTLRREGTRESCQFGVLTVLLSIVYFLSFCRSFPSFSHKENCCTTLATP